MVGGLRGQLVGMLSGGEGKPSEDDIARACCAQDLPALMAVHVGALEFEARKVGVAVSQGRETCLAGLRTPEQPARGGTCCCALWS